MKKIFFLFLMIGMGVTFSCSDSFLDVKPLGGLNVQSLSNRAGVEYLLTGAYSLLDGWGSGGTSYHSAVDNWVYGSVASDDAYKGTTSGDQPDVTFIETYNILPDNGYFRGKWRVVYDGVARANDVLQMLPKATDITDADKALISAEARFLRGHYHFEAKKMWNNIPYIDEATYDPMNPNSTKVSNTVDAWPKIEADFDFAYQTLADKPRNSQAGRPTKWSAAAYLAKAYMFQKKFAQAKTVLDAIVASGKYKLMDKYHDNFKASTKNNAESVFEVQFSVNDGAPNGQNGNNGATLNFPYAGVATCCGFFQPAQNLVNAFKTDANGLPLLADFNLVDVKNDQGIESKAAFTPDNTTLDPRLDWTVGRRGIPFLDYGLHPGKDWIRDQAYAGPYSPIKHIHYKSERGTLSSATGSGRQNANNYRMIRYSHVLLWLAECEVELGNLDAARLLVNLIRKRASNPAGFVKLADGVTNAANYSVAEYAAGGVYPFDTPDNARNAVRFEHRLEFGMEGHRYFDLVRWGIAESTLNTYVAGEKLKRTYLGSAVFKSHHIYFPIPNQEILNSSISGTPTLTQNPGY